MKVRRDSRTYGFSIRLLAGLGSLLVRLLAWSWRTRSEGANPFHTPGPFVAAVWHEGLVIAGGTYRDHGLAVPVSMSRDGDQVAAILGNLGFAESPRGSSSRGGTSALRQMIKRVRQGERIGVLTDGPRGPARQAKPGALALAAATGAPLVPVGFAARPALRLSSWDAAILPLPFARVQICYGERQSLPKKPSGDELEEQRLALSATLDELTRRAEQALD
ncbi:MAG: DUF374 domain-containing protein [Myxococcota bacterium]|nr:DUF374 domain-containing protein [Myxococcota bacterium]